MPSPKPMIQDGHEYREMNDIEFAQYQIDQAAASQAITDAKEKAEEKQIILKRLGLTAEELATLLS